MPPSFQVIPPFPASGWDKSLACLPKFTFRTISQHFTERTVDEVVGDVPPPVDPLADLADSDLCAAVDAAGCSDSIGTAGSDDDYQADVATAGPMPQKFASFRGLAKGYRFFKSGHIQDIEYHELPDFAGNCHIRCTALPSMRKDRKYKVRLCCTTSTSPADHIPTVLIALCSCPAGLAGCCNHVGGLLYALDDFVRCGLREEAGKACTEKLMQWNRPHSAHVKPRRVTGVHLKKHTFCGRDRRSKKKKIPFYDPRPSNCRLPNPDLVDRLTADLLKIEKASLAADATGHVKMYGTSTWLRLLESSPPVSSSDSEAEYDAEGGDSRSESGSSSDSEPGSPATQALVSGAEPALLVDEFYKQHVTITAERAAEIEAATRTQSATAIWHEQRRLRVTATMVKSIVCRRKTDFTAVIRRKLAPARYPTAAMRYGIKHEADAIKEYVVRAEKSGQPVTVVESGMVIHSDKQWLSVSPDGLVKDGDHTLKVLKVKCPYTMRDGMSIQELATRSTSFLTVNESAMQLKRNHSYYYQVQMQMFVCGVSHADFIVWSPHETLIESIEYNAPFITQCLPALEAFYFKHYLPALAAQ